MEMAKAIQLDTESDILGSVACYVLLFIKQTNWISCTWFFWLKSSICPQILS